MEEDSTYSASLKGSTIFSALILVGVFLRLGPSVAGIVCAIILIPVANLVFPKWSRRGPTHALVGILVRSGVVCVILSLLLIGWIKLFSSGQIGYGESLQIDGTRITLLGYQLIVTESLYLSATILVAAVLTSMMLFKANRR